MLLVLDAMVVFRVSPTIQQWEKSKITDDPRLVLTLELNKYKRWQNNNNKMKKNGSKWWWWWWVCNGLG